MRNVVGFAWENLQNENDPTQFRSQTGTCELVAMTELNVL